MKNRRRKASSAHIVNAGPGEQTRPSRDLLRDTLAYQAEFMRRCVVFLDILRERANNMLAHEQAGLPPLLDFEYETLLDARRFEHPANYTLLRITGAGGRTASECERPGARGVIIIDPRAGHGPGIGGFKRDSEVGMSLHEGHPTYFVIFGALRRPDAGRRHSCAAPIRGRGGATASGFGTSGLRQLPGRLGRGDGGRHARRPGRPRGDERLATFLLGRRVGREPDAAGRRIARRHMAHALRERSRHWIPAVYPTTKALEKAGQRIVYLTNSHVGHLGIFVSAGVARLEHRAILESLDDIERLAPGLYEMKIVNPTGDPDCRRPQYSVRFEPRGVEDIRFEYPDNAFERVRDVSGINEEIYKTWFSPCARHHKPARGTCAEVDASHAGEPIHLLGAAESLDGVGGAACRGLAPRSGGQCAG